MDSTYAAAYPTLYRHHWWWRVREEILVRRIGALLVGTPRARILDVGCGAGLFFDALERFGDIEGIESDERAVSHAGKWRDRIHRGQLDESFAPSAPYDLVLLLDVLEHLEDAAGPLRRAASLLAPHGRILITVPAFNWLWTKHDDLNHHVRRYTAPAMRATIHAAGLTTESTAYLFPSLVIPKVLVRIGESILGSSPRVPTVPAPLVNRTAQVALRAEQAIAGWVPFGTSLLAVAAPCSR